MSNSSLNVYRSGAETFRSEVDAWKNDHDKAMECFDLEDFLLSGIRVADGLALQDEQYRSRVFSGKESFSHAYHDEFMATYQHLVGAFQDLLEVVKEFESRFGAVKHASEFRERLREIQGILTPDDKFFGDGLVPLRDAAIDSHLGGETVECRTWE